MHRVTVSFAWPFSPTVTRMLLRFFFLTTLLSYLGLLLMERVWPGFVSLSFNATNIFWLTLGAGIVANSWPALIQTKESWTKTLSINLTIAGIIGGLLLLNPPVQLDTQGWLAILTTGLLLLIVNLPAKQLEVDQQTN